MSEKIVIHSASELEEALETRLGTPPFPGGAWQLRSGFTNAELDLVVNGQTHSFFLLFRPRLKTRDVRTIANQINTSTAVPMIVTLDLGDTLLRACQECGVAALGLNGQLFIQQPGLYINTSLPSLPVKYIGEQTRINPFAAKSCRITRALLANPGRGWKITDMAQAAGMSQSRVSEVLRVLADREWVTASRGDWRAADADALLDAWSQADSWTQRGTLIQYATLSHSLNAIAANLVAQGPQRVVFTQWIAANLRYPFSQSPVCTAYRDRPLSAQEQNVCGLEQVATGGKLWLVVPRDQGVFQFTQQVQGLPVVSDAQIYLDLVNAGMRGGDHARELRNWEGFCR